MAYTREAVRQFREFMQELEEDHVKEEDNNVDEGIDYILSDEYGHEIGDAIVAYDDEQPAEVVDDIEYREYDQLVMFKNAELADAAENNPKITFADLKEAEALSRAVTFPLQEERLRAMNLDAANHSKTVNQEHRSRKLAAFSAYREQYPTETAPMYTKERFFKAKEERSSRGHANRRLLADEMNASAIAKSDARDMFREDIDDLIEWRIAVLEQEEGKGFKIS